MARFRLSAGKDLGPGEIHLDEKDRTRELLGGGDRRALIEVGGDGEHLGRHAWFEREEIAERELVAHLRREGRSVVEERSDLGEIRSRSVDPGLYKDLIHVRSFRYREVRQGLPAELQEEARQRARKAGVVIERNLVVDEVPASVGVTVVAGRSADQRACEGVTAVHRIVDVVGPGAVRRAVMYVVRRVGAEAYQVTAVARVLPQRVIDLADREVVVSLLLDRIAQMVAIDQG